MRREIEKECAFLKEWGRLFRQCHADAPTRGFDKNYQTCVDTYEALQGKAMHFHKTDAALIEGLKAILKRLEERNKAGLFQSFDKYRNVVKEFDNIIEMLSVAENVSGQGSLF